MTSILDTSAVIGPVPVGFDDEVAISIITIAELQFGVMIAADQRVRGERLRRLSALQSQFDPLPIDGPVAAAFGRLAAALTGSGRQPQIRAMELFVAATAMANGARLATRNAADLIGLEDYVEIVPL
jgi:toxin FitB